MQHKRRPVQLTVTTVERKQGENYQVQVSQE